MDYALLSDVKNWLNITDGSEDTLLTRLISAASRLIDTYTGRDFELKAYTETYNGAGTPQLFLKNFPITAVSSLTIDTQSVPLAPNSLQYGFLFDDNLLYLVGGSYNYGGASGTGSGAIFPRGPRNVTVTYTAGLSATPAGLPQDIQQACIELVSLKFRRRFNIGKQSETLAQQVTTYITTDLTDEIKAILSKYQRVTPV